MANSVLKCAGCKNYFPREEMAIVAISSYHSTDCLRLHKSNLQKKKQRSGAHSSNKPVAPKAKRKGSNLSLLVERAQNSVNRYVKLRDFGLACISCGRSEKEIRRELGGRPGGAWHAGHFRSVASASQLRFNLLNINKQCAACNCGERLRGINGLSIRASYELNLAAKIGRNKVELLNANHSFATYNKEYLGRIRQVFDKKYLILESRLSILI